MNTFGKNFRVAVWGESHGEQIGVAIDGVPAGLALTTDDFTADLDRRRSGARGTTPRRESDTPHIVSGILNGVTTGAPLTVVFNNENTISSDYAATATHFRPSHADFVANRKFNGHNDPRGGGHFSGRITLTLTAAGVVAKKLMPDTLFTTRIIEIGGCTDSTRFAEVIDAAAKECDSVGGVIECRVSGVGIGIGEPFFDSVESVISHLLFSVPAVKGVEFGNGFEAARLRGSANNDMIINAEGTTKSNNSGGINGGITNGNELIVRVAVKPTPSIAREQQTYNDATGQVEPLVIHGRHDTCITLRAAVVVEAAVAIALAELKH